MFTRGLGCIVFSLYMAWKFAIVFLALVPFMSLFFSLMVFFVKKYTFKEQRSYGIAGQIAQEVLGAIRTVLALGMQRTAIDEYSRNLKQSEQMAIRKGLVSGFFFGISNGLFTSSFGIGVYYGAYLVRTECSNFGVDQIIPAFFSVITSSFTIAQAMPYLKELTEARLAAKRVFEILDTKSEMSVTTAAADSDKKRLPELKGDVQFKKIRFAYPSRPDAPVLNGLNLNIPAGKTIALVGTR
jgi:ATP-binding cassette subfamily B (MDR/TAP) protein 1